MTLEASSPREAAEALAQYMPQPTHLTRAREALSADAQTALEALFAKNGRIPVAAFERRFGELRPMGPGKLSREQPWNAPINATEMLWYRGFISRGFEQATPPREMMFIPDELYESLSRLASSAREAVAENVDESLLDSAQHSTLAQYCALLDDLTTLLAHCQNADVLINRDGKWNTQARATLLPMLRDSDELRLKWMQHMLLRIGCLRLNEDRKLRVVPNVAARWLQASSADQLDAMRRAWIDDPTWNDLAHVRGLSFDMTHAWANDPLSERAFIVQAHAQQPTLDTDALVAHIKHTAPDFARRDGRYDTWHIRDAASGEFLRGFEHWGRIEGALIRSVMNGVLSWLQLDADQTPSEARLSVLANGAVACPMALRFERFQLARIADFASIEPKQHSYRYQLSAASLARAAAQSISATRVVEFLRRHTSDAVPAQVIGAIERWGARGVEAKLSEVVLLQTKDEAALQTLLAAPILKNIKVRRVGNNSLLLDAKDADDVRRAAMQQGLLI